MTGLQAAGPPVPRATAIVGKVASSATRPMGRRIDAVLDRDTVPTVIENASRGALDDTAAAYPEIVGVLLDAHFSISARPPACRLARGWWLYERKGVVGRMGALNFMVLIQRRTRFWRQRRRSSSVSGPGFATVRR
jgi:hypothetical protein